MRKYMVRSVAHSVTDLQYEFWFKVLDTFNKSIGFVIALQMNGMFVKLLENEDANPFQLLVIFCLILVSMVLARISDKWASKMEERGQHMHKALTPFSEEYEPRHQHNAPHHTLP